MEQDKTSQDVGQAYQMPGTPAWTMCCFKADEVPAGTKLYVIPTARPLTDEQIDRIVDAVDCGLDGSGSDFRAFARAIERAVMQKQNT